MTQDNKQAMLGAARKHLADTRQAITKRAEGYQETLEKDFLLYREINGENAYEERTRAVSLAGNTSALKKQLEALQPSPYFARCDIGFAGEAVKPFYFGKFPASEFGIYSWTAPVASLRFEDPGEVTYSTTDGTRHTALLDRRDQYMVTVGELRFMTSEAQDYARELIYQEHFTVHKDGFVLPEIVAQMERAQDQVIRAHHVGPFVISGPAGSGKTTLALHRIAYLRQSPDTEPLYPPETILVFVQDARTQEYFSHLLPELGITDVRITTFASWALEVLQLKGYFHRIRPGQDEAEQDAYEGAKIAALANVIEHAYGSEKPEAFLQRVYGSFLDTAQFELLTKELGDGALDRHDLTALLLGTIASKGTLSQQVEHYTFLRGGKVTTTVSSEPMEASLILVDEFQNYLPQQLSIFKALTAKRHGSMLYVGDLAQQTQFGTIHDWTEIGETIPPDRAISLTKVYRNTRQILEFIRTIGYNVDIPEGLADGKPVVVQNIQSVDDALGYIDGLSVRAGGTMGVLAKDNETLESYSEALGGKPGVHCLTIREAQGVEFDVVCLVGVTKEAFGQEQEGPVNMRAERQRIDHDLLYVALTRAIRELHILGDGDQKHILEKVAQKT